MLVGNPLLLWCIEDGAGLSVFSSLLFSQLPWALAVDS